jgi:2-(1,2-epoxy-1,2-dihydrophenyl)acetyl-CoA isomerase
MIRADLHCERRLLRLALPPAGEAGLDVAALRTLSGLLMDSVGGQVRAVLIVRDAPDFALGVDVRDTVELEPDVVLGAWFDAMRAVVRCPVPVITAVRGRCLGRGASLALASHFLFAHEDTTLGFHEVALGLFSPCASALLPWRSPVLRRMLIAGELLDVHQLELAGLVTGITHRDPTIMAEHWFRQNLMERSLPAVRAATAAAAPGEEFEARLQRHVVQLREHLRSCEDPREGIQAFLEARPPRF